jgi:microcystin-dependent protein
MPSQPFAGEIMPWGGNFAPVGWLPCDGRLVAISEYDVLFTLIGTTYGGDGQTTFALPDLRGRGSIHSGQGPGLSNYFMGQVAGSESVALTSAQLPSHSHPVLETPIAAGNAPVPNGRIPAASAAAELTYGSPSTSPGVMAPGVISPATGGSQPHENRQSYLVINFCIAMFGIFPSQT